MRYSEKKNFIYIYIYYSGVYLTSLVCKGLHGTHDVRVARGAPCFRRQRPGAGFETGDVSLKKSWGRGLPYNDTPVLGS